MGNNLKIAIGSDHGGFLAKEEIVKYLLSKNYEVIDVGTSSLDSCNYSNFGIAVGELIKDKKCDFGVVICSSGEGICIAANKVKGVRCGIGYNDEVSSLLRKHNNANVISFGAKFMDVEDMKRRIDIFINTEFESGRHQIRVDTISEYEK